MMARIPRFDGEEEKKRERKKSVFTLREKGDEEVRLRNSERKQKARKPLWGGGVAYTPPRTLRREH